MSSLSRNHSLVYRGSAQLGDEIALGCVTTDTDGLLATPTAAPTMKVYDSSGVLVLTMSIPTHGDGRNTKVFGHRLFLGPLFSAGRYFVFYSWAVSTFNGFSEDYFDIRPGGNDDGHVIAAKWLATPGTNYVVYQTNDGAIHKGKNPRFS